MHLNNPSLSQVGLAALCNITIKLESNEVSRISENELEVVIQSMLAHRKVKVVQSNAIQALKNFTFSQSNLEVLGNDKHLVDTVLVARSVHRQGFQGRDEELLMSLPSWPRKTASGSSTSRAGLMDDRMPSKVDMDDGLGKSWSNSSFPSNAAAAQSKPGSFAVPSSEGTSLKKGNNTSLQTSYNSEHGSAHSHPGDESRPGAVMVTSGNSLLDRRMRGKSEQASTSSQPNASASSSQDNRLLDERTAKKLEKEETSCVGMSSTPGARHVPSNSALDRRVKAKQRKGLLGKMRDR